MNAGQSRGGSALRSLCSEWLSRTSFEAVWVLSFVSLFFWSVFLSVSLSLFWSLNSLYLSLNPLIFLPGFKTLCLSSQCLTHGPSSLPKSSVMLGVRFWCSQEAVGMLFQSIQTYRHQRRIVTILKHPHWDAPPLSSLGLSFFPGSPRLMDDEVWMPARHMVGTPATCLNVSYDQSQWFTSDFQLNRMAQLDASML